MKVRELPEVESILRSDVGAIARALTGIEREAAGSKELLEELLPRAGRARRVVLTGPPGVGKSSLLRELMRTIRKRGESIAVLACDPTSPYTRGSFLGDRVRWSELADDTGIFVRSIAHRGPAIISEKVWRFADLLDAAGYSWIFIETVGAGQADVPERRGEARRVLVLSPGSGDEMQMLKAGFLECADVYVVNKADLPGAARWARELEETLCGEDGEPARVISTVASTGEGAAELVDLLSSSKRRTKSCP